METYLLSIITPDGKILEENITSLVAQGTEGSFGILAHHTPFVTLLKEGTLKLKNEETKNIYKTGAGILEVQENDKVTILVDYANLEILEKARN
jgi:F-type H+-transporting ATPase subunit epsilon